MKKMMKRISFNVLILVSMVFLPWWLTAVLIVTGFFVFEKFYEGIVFGFIVDALYGAPRTTYEDFMFLTLVFAVTFFMLSDIMKSKLRMY